MNTVVVGRQVRPASVNNPVRPDKTRAPSDWDHSWYRQRGGRGVARIDVYAGTPWHETYTARGAINVHEPQSHWSATDWELGRRMKANARLAALAGYSEEWKQLSAAAAEARKTLVLASRFTRTAAHELGKAAEVLERRRRAEKLRMRSLNWRDWPSKYLAWIYAIAPLADDVRGAFNQLAPLAAADLGMRMALVKRWDHNEEFRPRIMGGLPGGFSQPYMVGGRVFTYGKVVYLYELPGWFLEKAAPPLAPFSTAYELTRASFILDWFAPVGNWMGAMEAAQIAPFFKEGSETVVVKSIYDLATSTLVPHPALLGQISSSGQIEVGRMERRRVIHHPFAWDNGIARKPFPKLQLATQGLALLTQAVLRYNRAV